MYALELSAQGPIPDLGSDKKLRKIEILLRKRASQHT
jgi:hypothetical protein